MCAVENLLVKANVQRRGGTYDGHLEVTEFIPEIFQGVCTHESGNKETNPFDTADATDRPTCHSEPDPPVDGKGPAKCQSGYSIDTHVYSLVLLVDEFSETEYGSKREEDQH